MSVRQLRWTYPGYTKGANPGDLNFGQVWDGRPFWIGNFSRSDRAEVLFYYPGDGNWWLGTYDGTRLRWAGVGNTLGANTDDPNFGQVWDGRPFWVGNFSRSATSRGLSGPKDSSIFPVMGTADGLSWVIP